MDREFISRESPRKFRSPACVYHHTLPVILQVRGTRTRGTLTPVDPLEDRPQLRFLPRMNEAHPRQLAFQMGGELGMISPILRSRTVARAVRQDRLETVELAAVDVRFLVQAKAGDVGAPCGRCGVASRRRSAQASAFLKSPTIGFAGATNASRSSIGPAARAVARRRM